MSSYKEKWLIEGVSEGYYSAMAQVMTYIVVYQNGLPDQLIIDFELKRKDFLKCLDIEDIEEIDKISDLLPEKARKIWVDK